MGRRSATILALPLVLAACGGSASTETLSVSCDGSKVLAGASSVDVVVDPGKGTSLSFPDPVNAGKTGTIAVRNRCTITPK